MVESYWLYEDKLQGEYKDAYQTIGTYVNASAIDEQGKRDLFNTLLDMLLVAQEEGQPPQKVTGTDMERFCQNFCSGYGTKEHTTYFIERIMILVRALLFISSCEMIMMLYDYAEGIIENPFTASSRHSLLQYGVGLGLILLASVIFDFLMKKYLFRLIRKKVWLKVIRFLYVVVVLALGVLVIYAYANDINILPDIPVFLTFMVTVVLTSGYHFATREHRRESRRDKVSFWKYVYENGDTMPEMERKQFLKTNRKREKKGLPVLTQEEYLHMEKEKCEQRYQNPFRGSFKGMVFGFCIGLFGTLVAFFRFGKISDGSGERIQSLFDKPSLLILLGIAVALVLLGSWKINRKYLKEKMDWIQKEMGKIDPKIREN